MAWNNLNSRTAVKGLKDPILLSERAALTAIVPDDQGKLYLETRGPQTLVDPGLRFQLEGDPTQTAKLATQSFVLENGGLDFKNSVVIATNVNINVLTGAGIHAGESHDGITLVAADRILLKSQTDPTENGIYIVKAANGYADTDRSADFVTGTVTAGAYMYVDSGTTNGGKSFVLRKGVWAPGPEVTIAQTTGDDLEIVQFSGKTAAIIQDADNDTYINCEVTTDDDKLQFYTANGKRLDIDSSGNFDLDSGTLDIDAAGNITIDTIDASSINIGTSTAGTHDTSAINIGTSATAREITVGNAASTFVNLNASDMTYTCGSSIRIRDTTATFMINNSGDVSISNADNVDFDSTGPIALNSSGAAINIGNDAVAQAINIGTGASARAITVGNAASTFVNLKALNINFTSVDTRVTGDTKVGTDINDLRAIARLETDTVDYIPSANPESGLLLNGTFTDSDGTSPPTSWSGNGTVISNECVLDPGKYVEQTFTVAEGYSYIIIVNITVFGVGANPRVRMFEQSGGVTHITTTGDSVSAAGIIVRGFVATAEVTPWLRIETAGATINIDDVSVRPAALYSNGDTVIRGNLVFA
jgi:hypothetical protein